MKSDTLDQLVDIIAGVTGNEPETVVPEADLEDDLGIVLDEDFTRLIFNINQKFDIQLDEESVSEVVSTVADLGNIIDEELELG